MSGNVTENVFTIFREHFEKFTKKNEKIVDRKEKYGYDKRHSQGIGLFRKYSFPCAESPE